MSDTYQAVYDAVRSRICGGNIGEAVEEAMRNANVSHYVEMAYREVENAASEILRVHTEPSAVFKPKIYMEGNQWCALYGEDLQSGVAGFGDSPALAMRDFDRAWRHA